MSDKQRIKYWQIIDQAYNLFKNSNNSATKNKAYQMLIDNNLITPNGKPTKFSIKNHLVVPIQSIDKTNTNKYHMGKLGKICKIPDLIHIDSKVYFSNDMSFSTSILNRCIIDFYIHQVSDLYIPLVMTDIDRIISYCSRMYHFLSRVSTSQIAKFNQSKYKNIHFTVSFVRRKAKYYLRAKKVWKKASINLNSKHFTDYTISDWVFFTVIAKILEWQLLPTIPKELDKYMVAEYRYGCRNLIESLPNKIKTSDKLDYIKDNVNLAKSIWSSHIFSNDLNDERKFWRIEHRVK